MRKLLILTTTLYLPFFPAYAQLGTSLNTRPTAVSPHAPDNSVVSSGGTAVNAFTAGHVLRGGQIINPNTATENLCIDFVHTAATTASSSTICIAPGGKFEIPPNINAVSVNAATSGHAFSGVGYYNIINSTNNNNGVPYNGVPIPVLTAKPGNQSIYLSLLPVTANPPILSYSYFCGNTVGTEASNPIYNGLLTSYLFTGLTNGDTRSCWATANSLAGFSASSPETSSSTITLPNTGSFAQLYPSLLGRNGGSNTPTPISNPTTPIIASYDDYGQHQQWNTFFNLPVNSTYSSIHTGHANASDWADGLCYEIGCSTQGNAGDATPPTIKTTNSDGSINWGATGYQGPIILSLSLLYPDSSGTPGYNLSAAAAGNYNAQYYLFGRQLATTLYAHQAVTHQSLVRVRGAEEYNELNSASSPWYFGGTGPNGISNAINLKNALTNYSQQIKAGAASVTIPTGLTPITVLIVQCFQRDGDDPRPGFLAKPTIDILAEDNYTNQQFGDPTDANTDFDYTRTTSWGLDFLVAQGKILGVPVALPEFGVKYPNYAQYIYRFFDYVETPGNNFDYVTFWNSSGGGGYYGTMMNGANIGTAAAARYRINPASFPVKPLPYPENLTAGGGDGQITVTMNPAPAELGTVSYEFYTGTISGGENILTAAATSATPSATIPTTNGNVVYVVGAFVDSAGHVSFLSNESNATAMAAPANSPAHYVTMGSTGQITSNVPNNFTPTGAFCRTVSFKPEISDMSNNHPLDAVWGVSGYLRSYKFGVTTSGNPFLVLHDSSNNEPAWFGSGVSLTVGNWWTESGCYNPSDGSVQFAWGPRGGTMTNLAPVSGPANFSIAIAGYDAGLQLNPANTLGGDIGAGEDHFAGAISESLQTNNGVVVGHPIVNASGVGDTTSGRSWNYTGTLH